MRPPTPTRPAALALLLLTAMLHAQSRTPASPQSAQTTTPSAIPATAPTNTPTPNTPAPPLPPAQSPPSRANVSFANGQLTVSASNSSLNQILREISRLTGIKITGGVAEERVFGDYGPATPAEVLGTLLDGTSSNIFFTASEGDKPAELLLTPRTGGITPPNPNAARFDETADDNGQPAPPPAQPVESQSQPARPNPVAAPIQPPPPDANTNAAPQQPTTQPADSTQQQSPNGVKTPQQIYDELMRLRRQQQTQPQ